MSDRNLKLAGVDPDQRPLELSARDQWHVLGPVWLYEIAIRPKDVGVRDVALLAEP